MFRLLRDISSGSGSGSGVGSGSGHRKTGASHHQSPGKHDKSKHKKLHKSKAGELSETNAENPVAQALLSNRPLYQQPYHQHAHQKTFSLLDRLPKQNKLQKNWKGAKSEGNVEDVLSQVLASNETSQRQTLPRLDSSFIQGNGCYYSNFAPDHLRDAAETSSPTLSVTPTTPQLYDYNVLFQSYLVEDLGLRRRRTGTPPHISSVEFMSAVLNPNVAEDWEEWELVRKNKPHTVVYRYATSTIYHSFVTHYVDAEVIGPREHEFMVDGMQEAGMDFGTVQYIAGPRVTKRESIATVRNALMELNCPVNSEWAVNVSESMAVWNSLTSSQRGLTTSVKMALHAYGRQFNNRRVKFVNVQWFPNSLHFDKPTVYFIMGLQ